MQVLCHRKFSSFKTTEQPILERSRAAKAINALWPSVSSLRHSTQATTPGTGKFASADSSFSSASESSFSDCLETPADDTSQTPSRGFQNQKKSRLLATFCLRRLLSTSARVCQDVWPTLMPEPVNSTQIVHPAPSRRTPQPDLITLIFKERDYRLRQVGDILPTCTY